MTLGPGFRVLACLVICLSYQIAVKVDTLRKALTFRVPFAQEKYLVNNFTTLSSPCS